MAPKKSGQNTEQMQAEVPRQWYKANDDVYLAMENLVRLSHPHLMAIVDKIAILVKTGAGQKVGQVSKASPQIGVLADKEYVFVMRLTEEKWAELNDNQRIAALDHLLCACHAEEAGDGSMKYSIVKPELEYFRGELERHGFWQHSGTTGEDLVNRIFG